MTAENQAAATEAQAPVLQPEDLSGPDAGRDPAAGTAPPDGPESQPEAAEAPEAAEPAAAAAPEPAPRVSLRELEARIAVPLQCAAEPHWPDLMKRAAADQEPWAELTDSLIAAGHAEMYDRQVRVWFGDKAPAAAA